MAAATELVIGVFCGSSAGSDPAYEQTARETGHVLAEAGIGIVYGGGRVGLMGTVADAAIEAGGRVVGVMPRALVDSEIAHAGLTELHVVENMHQRKARMSELATGFVALPGGAGTLEEIFEQWTWAQLGIHQKPCGFLNIKGYYDPLRTMAQKMVDEGFMKQSYADMLVFTDRLDELLDRFRNYTPPPRKWMPASEPVKP